MRHPPAPLRVSPPLLREGERTLWPGRAGSTVDTEHPPAPLRVSPPLLREGERTLWPGRAGSTGALVGAPEHVTGSRAPRNRLCRAASAVPLGGRRAAAQGG